MAEPSEHIRDRDLVGLRAALARGVSPDADGWRGPLLLEAEWAGWTEGLRLLLEAGADEASLGWSPLHRAVALGTVDDVRALLPTCELEAWDNCCHTALILAALVGDADKVSALAAAGADLTATGEYGETALHFAAERGRLELMARLLALGCDPDAETTFGDTALGVAVSRGGPAAVQLLLGRGPSERAVRNALENSHDRRSVARLVDHGLDPALLDRERFALWFREGEGPDCTVQDYQRAPQRIFGRANPEPTDHAFWHAMIRCGVNAWQGRRHLGVEGYGTWCFDRFGRTITRLPDGRLVLVAGEHEDWYDPDFCIYNDVLVVHPGGRRQLFGYPEDVFPPTDFHTATLVDQWIYLVGSLGYPRHRVPGSTPVFRLELDTWRIERIHTTGTAPGWIAHHRARLEAGALVVSGGKRYGPDGAREDVSGTWRLHLPSHAWTSG